MSKTITIEITSQEVGLDNERILANQALIAESLNSMNRKLDEINSKLDSKPIEPSIDTKPPIEVPIDQPTTPPITVGVENFTQTWMDSLADDRINQLVIPSGKTLQINPIKISPLSRKLEIITDTSEPSNIISGVENYKPHLGGQDPYLILLKSGAIFNSNRINFCQPKQLKSSAPWTPSIFQSTTDVNAEYTALVQNCDTTALGRNGGMGVGFLYGGKNQNHIGLVNFKHAGPGLISAKNPFLGGRLVWTLDNVFADFTDPLEFGNSTIHALGFVKDGKFHITSDNVTTDMFFDNGNFTVDRLPLSMNFNFIIHIGRFTFEFEGKQSIIDDKTIQLRPQPEGKTKVRVLNGRCFVLGFFEPHVGDSFYLNGRIYEVIEKDRTEYREWAAYGTDPVLDIARCHALKLDSNIEDGYYEVNYSPQSISLPEQPAMFMYKGNFNYRTSIQTVFGNDHYINQTHIEGHQCYNQPNIDIWAKDSLLNGYYRCSAAQGKTTKPEICNFINTPEFGGEFRAEYFDGEKNVKVPITHDPSIPMPSRILNLLR